MKARKYTHVVGQFAYLPYGNRRDPIGKITGVNHIVGTDLYIARFDNGSAAFNMDVICDVNGNPFYPQRVVREKGLLDVPKDT